MLIIYIICDVGKTTIQIYCIFYYRLILYFLRTLFKIITPIRTKYCRLWSIFVIHFYEKLLIICSIHWFNLVFIGRITFVNRLIWNFENICLIIVVSYIILFWNSILMFIIKRLLKFFFLIFIFPRILRFIRILKCWLRIIRNKSRTFRSVSKEDKKIN